MNYDNPIEELVLICSSKLPACSRLLNDEIFKTSLQTLPVKLLFVDDEYTKMTLLKVNVATLPLMILKIGEDILEVKHVNYILKVLEDLLNKQQQTTTVVALKKPEEEKQLFKAQVLYKTDDFIVSFINCDKFMTAEECFDLVIMSENCRKVHFQNENHIIVNGTNVNSLRKIVPFLTEKEKKNILVVSKTKRLADLVSSLCMFYIQQSGIDEIQNTTSIPKKTLLDLFDINE
jgi:hypothetical protein